MVTECGMNRTMSWLFFAFPPRCGGFCLWRMIFSEAF